MPVRALALFLALAFAPQALGASKLLRPSMGALSKKFPGKKPPPTAVVFTAALTGNCEASVPTATTGQTLAFTRASSGTCTKNDGSLVTLASNVPRVNQYGFLAEASANNLALKSAAFDHATWLKLQSGAGVPVVTANTSDVTDPFGTNLAEKIVFPAVGAAQYSILRQGSISTSAGPYSWGVYLRTLSGSATVYIVGTDGSYKGSTSCSVTTTWARCKVENVSLNTATSAFDVGINTGAGQAQSAAPQTLYAYGYMVQSGSSLSALVLTDTTTVTRSADSPLSATVTLPSSEGCMAATVRSLSPSPTSGARLLSWSSTDSLYIASNTSLTYFTTAASGDPAITVPALQDRSARVVADWSSSSNFNRITSEGVTASTTHVAFAAASTLYIGARDTGANPTQGYVSDVRVVSLPGGCP